LHHPVPRARCEYTARHTIGGDGGGAMLELVRTADELRSVVLDIEIRNVAS
jgi:hypothetical protein